MSGLSPIAIIQGRRRAIREGLKIEALVPHLEKGIFTTARIHKGQVEGIVEHAERFQRESKIKKIDPAYCLKSLEMAQELAAEAPSDAMCRVIVGIDAVGRQQRIVTLEPLRRPLATPKDAPKKITLSEDTRVLPVCKDIDRGAVSALEVRAKAQGCFGTVLWGPEGVREGTFFHVFVRIDNYLVTPPLSVSVCFGTSRSAFLRLRDDAVEGEVSVRQLKESSEIFVTNALIGAARAELMG